MLTGNVAVAPSGTKTVVPADATGVIVNVTIVNPSAPGFLSLRPTGATGAPATSTVNFSAAGAIVPNSATVALGTGGSIQIWVEIAGSVGSADVLIDIVGYTVDHNHDDRYYTEAEVDAAVAAASAVAFVSNDVGATLSTTPAVLLTLPVTAPADGTLIVDGMVNIVDSASSASVNCWIGLDSTATTRAHAVQVLAANVGEWNDTRGFPVTAGDHTLTLSCEQQGTTSPMAAVQLRNLTATFSSNTL